MKLINRVTTKATSITSVRSAEVMQKITVVGIYMGFKWTKGRGKRIHFSPNRVVTRTHGDHFSLRINSLAHCE